MKKNTLTNAKKYLPIIFIFAMFLLLSKNITAKTSEWNVKIFNTKNFEETQNIIFKVEDSDNVLKGKIAPGLKAYANIEIDLTGTKVPVDINVEIDDKKLNNAFKLTTKLDGKFYNLGTTESIKLEKGSKYNKSNGKKILTLEIEWINDNNENDTMLGINDDSITIPVKINVKQQI